MRLDDGWNQIQFNLSDFTRRAYGEASRAPHLRLAMPACWQQWVSTHRGSKSMKPWHAPVHGRSVQQSTRAQGKGVAGAACAHQTHHCVARLPLPLLPPRPALCCALPACSSHTLCCASPRAGTNYIETLRVQVHANCRIRRIYFSDRLYSEEELPPEFKLFLPIQK